MKPNLSSLSKLYTMKQVCDKTSLSYDTLKFYCNVGLVPNVKRNQRNHRVFDDHDIAWINSLQCLKGCNMSISEMKYYIDLCQIGQSTIPERQAILAAKLLELQAQIDALRASISYIHHKQQFYEDVLAGKREHYSNLIKD